ncbi:hypothetical protein AAGS40_27205 (plasmid) [Paraburkholderia sp. PREW-6R]|uniref:hypothetical protein n=1 Tax=Paraburkholderia sp. PREW-6R TaxID=3141544 RepID=UPI0031F56ADB
MIPATVREFDGEHTKGQFEDLVNKMSVAELESISVQDISSLESNVLKDVLNDAVSSCLRRHHGGTYTSPAKISVGELNKT